MTCEEIELPKKYTDVRYDVYRFDGQCWWLNAHMKTLYEARALAEKLLLNDNNICTRIVERNGKVVG